MTTLLLSNTSDVTADHLQRALIHGGIAVVRLDSDALPGGALLDYDSTGGAELELSPGTVVRADDVANIIVRRPRRLGIHPTADPAESSHLAGEWREALEGFLAHVKPSRWINHPAANVMASHKIEQLTRARHMGLLVPQTLVTQRLDLVEAFMKAHPEGIVAKPLASGYLERSSGHDSIIYTSLVRGLNQDDDHSLRSCPTLFQERIVKTADVRVTVIDDEVIAMKLSRSVDGVQILDIRRDNMEGVEYERVSLPSQVCRRLLAYLRSYSLRFAAVDFVIDRDGEWYFLEVNPNGQWAWLDLYADAGIAAAFVRVLER